MQAAEVIKNRPQLLSCGSTQRVAAAGARVRSGEFLVCSEYQSRGQGQRGRHWHAAPGENLLFTLLLRPAFLAPPQLFMLNIIAALSLYDVLAPLSLPELCIKWPNDVYAAHKKLAGILLASKLQHAHARYALLGIGLNVAQRHFALPQASSLSLLLDTTFDKAQLLTDWLHRFAAYYEQLRTPTHHPVLRARYGQRLFARARKSLYRAATGAAFSATLLGIDARGRLQLDTAQGMQYFLPGTLQYLGYHRENT